MDQCNCCVCGTTIEVDGTRDEQGMVNSGMVNPFSEQQYVANRFPRRYAHACTDCIEKCKSGVITEEKWNEAAFFPKT